jgi:hypothetical protein
MGAIVLLSPGTLDVAPGDVASLDVRIRNAGNVVDEFAIQVLGDASAWATVEPRSLKLFPGEESSCTVRFAAPRVPWLTPGALPFGIKVTPRESPDGPCVEEGDLVVGTFAETHAVLQPRSSMGSGTATAEIVVVNDGNTPLDVVLEARDPDQIGRAHV